MKNESFLIYEYDKKYLKQIVELFINTVYNINKYDLNIWETRFEKYSKKR